MGENNFKHLKHWVGGLLSRQDGTRRDQQQRLSSAELPVKACLACALHSKRPTWSTNAAVRSRSKVEGSRPLYRTWPGGGTCRC